MDQVVAALVDHHRVHRVHHHVHNLMKWGEER
uniref:Uncharacterized protein n=1 Tax=Bacillus cereus HuA4-10 TaxID=1053206 RepID=J8D9V3_BACCE|nr:hypothetical protein IGC_05139 [Bacillus cereus HuA4-10]